MNAEPLIQRQVDQALAAGLDRETRAKLEYVTGELQRGDRDPRDVTRLTAERRSIVRRSLGLSEPVRIADTRLMIDEATGELVEWRGLNTEPARRPVVACDVCGNRCSCAPCRCPRCEKRHRRPAGEELVLF